MAGEVWPEWKGKPLLFVCQMNLSTAPAVTELLADVALLTFFIDPELGRIGLNETEAKLKGLDVRVVTLPMASVPRARTLGETRGFMKVLLDNRSDRILGFTMLGPEAGEVIAVVQTAMLAGLPYTMLREAIFTHPTMA